jgi:ETFB lysine methyltransferase
MSTFADLLNKYTIESEISVARHRFYLKRIEDCEPLLEIISEQDFNEDERIPYWAELWPSSVALAEYIIENEGLFSNKSVIELGCGLGLSGMAAHLAGANILFTDYDTYALDYTKMNFLRNFKQKAHVRILDWRDQNFDTKFDILIAADVLYEKRWLRPVFETIINVIKPGGLICLAEPGRTVASDFFEMIDEVGWQTEKFEKIVNFESEDRKVNIYKIKID